jgi:glycosyltransferase involved in cell wall biosynthesis
MLEEAGRSTDRRGSAELRVAYFVAYPNSLSGATRSLLELVTNLPANVKPMIVVPDDGCVVTICRDNGIDCRVVRAPQSLLRFGKEALNWSVPRKGWVLAAEVIPYAVRLARVLSRSRVQLLHANCPRAALLGGIAGRLCRVPVVGHLRGRQPYSSGYRRAFELACDRIITVCKAMHADLSPRARAKAITVYNGVRDPRTAGARATTSRLRWLSTMRARGEPIVGCFATVTPFKGQHHLLDAVARLKQQGMKSGIFMCVGKVAATDAEYEAWLWQRIKEARLDNFVFTGWQRDPFEFYAQADLTVLPSIETESLVVGGRRLAVRGNEGFPRTHLESMSLGLPVIGTDIAGVREQIVDGLTGFVVPPAAPGALADALGRLMRDSELRRGMGEAGRERVLEQFSIHRCVTDTLAVYESLVSTRLGESARQRDWQSP